MTEFTSYNAGSHPLVKVNDDWNSLLDHGLEKTASYIIRKNGVYYEAIQGGGATPVVIHSFANVDAASEYAISCQFDVPSNWSYKVTLAGVDMPVQSGLWGVYY
jgi:hypothetical protein